MSATRVSLPNRLAYENEKRTANRERTKRELEDVKMKECSFQPNIKRYASQAMINVEKFNQRAPMHERVGELMKEKRDR